MNYYSFLVVLASFLLIFSVGCLPNLFFIISKDIPDGSRRELQNSNNTKTIDTLPPYSPPQSCIIEINNENGPPSYENTIQMNEEYPSVPPPAYIDLREHDI
ncbi:hypothetical protein BCR36DRAFT_587697 [Piromyces finnis]|uniref:Uncharacterized protein n=1 Tax=Piromyces finnis TaxID=1754191 RepID=A0A1Y1UUY8_9FUNG|nr:hypothetical protein BCR36DRAFT_587697 [Piromyces finnis]|eukprot:ORX41838.1 hypothetical protein BCR36DRAFT_587697 [Piromyces finnis]